MQLFFATASPWWGWGRAATQGCRPVAADASWQVIWSSCICWQKRGELVWHIHMLWHTDSTQRGAL